MRENQENIALGLLISYYRGGGKLTQENAYDEILQMFDVAETFLSIAVKTRTQDGKESKRG